MRLAEVRERLELSQAEVAAGMGCSKSWVAQLEKKPLHRLRVKYLIQYLAACGCDLRLEALPDQRTAWRLG